MIAQELGRAAGTVLDTQILNGSGTGADPKGLHHQHRDHRAHERQPDRGRHRVEGG